MGRVKSKEGAKAQESNQIDTRPICQLTEEAPKCFISLFGAYLHKRSGYRDQ